MRTVKRDTPDDEKQSFPGPVRQVMEAVVNAIYARVGNRRVVAAAVELVHVLVRSPPPPTGSRPAPPPPGSRAVWLATVHARCVCGSAS